MAKLTVKERRERAFALFAQGYSRSDVAKRLRVKWETADRYHKLYEASIEQRVRENPQLLQDALANTFKMLDEIQQLRKQAWDELNRKKSHDFCEECGCNGNGLSHEAKRGYLNSLEKLIQDEAKILGVLGVKQEALNTMFAVSKVQQVLLEFMLRELCSADRAALLAKIESPELAPYFTSQAAIPAAIDVPSIERAS